MRRHRVRSELDRKAGGVETEVRIDSLAAGGDGVGRLADGRVVFVAWTAPGDRVRVRIEEEKPRFVRARLLEVLEAGAGRCTPRCEVFGQCGGCAWQHLDYTTQLESKRRILCDALARIAKLPLPGEILIHASSAPYGYRTRTRVRVESGRVGYRARRSHDLCAVESCPVLVGSLEQGLQDLAGDTGPGDPASEFELVASVSGAIRVTQLPTSGSQLLPTGPRLDVGAGGERLDVSPGVFVQANASLFDRLIDAVARAANPGCDPVGLVLELFAGAGFLTRRLARDFDAVVAVESFHAAVRDLGVNLAALQLDNVEVLHADVEEVLLERSFRPDVIVLDPPRTGLPTAIVPALAAMEARRIVYLSCDPATLARDLAKLCMPGWRLGSVEIFDLFPQTPHIETLAVLERVEGLGASSDERDPTGC